MILSYSRLLPFAPDRVYAQYFDLEHVVHVHPRTLGEARLRSVASGTILWELWHRTALGIRVMFLVALSPRGPNKIRMRVVRGPLRGSGVATALRVRGRDTLVTEKYVVPLPRWEWLRRWLGGRLRSLADRAWDEDVRVGMCFGGWPGVPDLAARRVVVETSS